MSVQGRILQTTFWLLVTIGLMGCGGPSPTKIKGNIETSQDVNPDTAGQPSPVVLRIYQLRSPGPFMKAGFFELYDNENAALGDNLIRSEEFHLQPGQALEYNTKFDSEAKYVGVIAAYRDWENARWRELVSLPDKRTVHLNIVLESLSVSVSTAKR